jgi:hypothetical protein
VAFIVLAFAFVVLKVSSPIPSASRKSTFFFFWLTSSDPQFRRSILMFLGKMVFDGKNKCKGASMKDYQAVRQ